MHHESSEATYSVHAIKSVVLYKGCGHPDDILMVLNPCMAGMHSCKVSHSLRQLGLLYCYSAIIWYIYDLEEI